MAEKWRQRALLALAGLILANAGMAWARAGQGPLNAWVPADGAVPGWSRDGDSREYVGEDLFVYIDGGAEIYQEYGFRRVILQDYRNAGGKSVSLEIFEMETPAAAYGIFTFKRSGEGKIVPLGSGAELEDYYLNFWKGRFLVTLTGFDGTPGTVDGLLAVAGAVDSKMSERAEVPDLVAALPGGGLRPGSVKYLKGLLGLNNVYAFHTAHGLGFGSAVKGEYEDGSILIVMDYGSSEACSKAWAELRTYLEETNRFKRSGAAEAAIPVYLDGKGRYVAFAQTGPRLIVGVSLAADAAIGLAERALR